MSRFGNYRQDLTASSRFGSYLRQTGVLTEAQLEEALRSQNVYGGRLGTNLLELGFLVLEELAAHLSDFHRVPLPPADWLEELDPQAVKAVPSSIVRRCKILPLKLEQHVIHVAMLDPKDPEHLDFVAMAAGRAVIPYILPEIRLLYWLETHLGIDRHPRYVNLAQRVRMVGASAEELASATPLSGVGRSNERQLAPGTLEEVAGAAEPPALPATAPAEDTPPPAAAEEARNSEEVILLEELVIEPMAESSRPAAPTTRDQSEPDSRPGAVAFLEMQLESATERDEIIRLGLAIARCYCNAAALFVQRGGNLSGISANGQEMEQVIRGVELPVATVSIFTQPALTTQPFRGSPPRDGIDGRILEAMNRGAAQEVFLHPVVIRNRVVNVLYADNGADHFGDTSPAALSALCSCISRAYERLILDGKQG